MTESKDENLKEKIGKLLSCKRPCVCDEREGIVSELVALVKAESEEKPNGN